MPQAPESFVGLKTTLPGSLSYSGVHWSPSLPNPFANQVEELYKNYPTAARRAQIQQQPSDHFDFGRPARPAAPAFCRPDTANWTPMALSGHGIQHRHHDSVVRKDLLNLGVSSWSVSSSTTDQDHPDVAPAPEPPAVAFIDFLGVGAA